MTCGCNVVHRQEAMFCELCGIKLSEPMKIEKMMSKDELLNILSSAFKNETNLSQSEFLLCNRHLEIWNNGKTFPILRMNPHLCLGFNGYVGEEAIELLQSSLFPDLNENGKL